MFSLDAKCQSGNAWWIIPQTSWLKIFWGLVTWLNGWECFAVQAWASEFGSQIPCKKSQRVPGAPALYVMETKVSRLACCSSLTPGSKETLSQENERMKKIRHSTSSGFMCMHMSSLHVHTPYTHTQCTCTQVCGAYRQRYLGTFIFTTSMLSGNRMVNKMLKNKNFNYYQLKIYLLFKVWDDLCSY